MKKIIHNLRSQSEEVRIHILHASTIIAGIILIILWIYSLETSLGSEGVEVKAKRDLEPFSALKDNMISGYNSISE